MSLTPLDISAGITGWYDGYSYDNSNSVWKNKLSSSSAEDLFSSQTYASNNYDMSTRTAYTNPPSTAGVGGFYSNNPYDANNIQNTTYTVILYGGYTAKLKGWSHLRAYAKSFLLNTGNYESSNPASIKVEGLVQGEKYAYRLYSYGTSGFANKTHNLKVNGTNWNGTDGNVTQTDTGHYYQNPSATGEAIVNSAGKIEFIFDYNTSHLQVCGLVIIPIGGGSGVDLSGNDITGTLTPSIYHTPAHLVSYRNNKKYMQKMFKYIAGSTTSRITFPTGFLADTSYTLFHVARRDPNGTDLNGRIFDGNVYILEAGAGALNGTGGLQGDASASSTEGGYAGLQPMSAFNNTIANANDGWLSEYDVTFNHWLSFEFPTEKYITKYKIWARHNATSIFAPKDWQLLGIRDGVISNIKSDFSYNIDSSYTIIDTQSGQTGWSPTTTADITNDTNRKEYYVANPGYYKYYILHITDNDDASPNYVMIGQLAYYSNSNWYSGFSDASSGVAAHDASYVNTTDRKYGNNWVVSVDRPNYYRSIGYSDFSSGYYDISSGSRTDNASPSSVPQLTINNGSTTLSSCDWNVAEVFACNKRLSGSEEDSLVDYLKFKYLGTNQVSTGDPHIYQLTHDISAVDASNTQQMIKGLPPDISAQTNLIGWYIPESYNIATNPGFWTDATGHGYDLSNCGTSPEFVDKDSTYNWISYIKGSKGEDYDSATGFIFPENLLPTDGSYTIIHVARRVKDASGNATGRIFDSASNKNFYSGFVGSKSGVALHSVDVSASR